MVIRTAAAAAVKRHASILRLRLRLRAPIAAAAAAVTPSVSFASSSLSLSPSSSSSWSSSSHHHRLLLPSLPQRRPLATSASAPPSAPKKPASTSSSSSSSTTTTTTTTTSAAPSSSSSSYDIRVGLLIKRNPVILAPQGEFEREYHLHRQRQERAEARPFNVEFYFKKGTEAERRWLKAQEAVGATPERPSATRRFDRDLANLVAGEVKGPITKADERGDVAALDRKLDQPLYLAVLDGKTGKWALPAGKLDGQELLHEAADRHVKEMFGTLHGDTFFIKHVIIAGNPKPKGAAAAAGGKKKGGPQQQQSQGHDGGIAWLTREELQGRMDASEFAALEGMLPSPSRLDGIDRSINRKKRYSRPCPVI
ncbi:hypothetical protein DFJ73DRAFT_779663 [Zopfochytrium polystomum]|nr:hypothetical protein DFJ73DRAFT_779663 [Zopfochytrium polystomum]